MKQYFLDPLAQRITGQVDASVRFERDYRMFGAVTALDQRQRFGNYYTFFWVARRTGGCAGAAGVSAGKTPRLRPGAGDRLPAVRGAITRTEFAILGDDFYDDGRVIAWRASLIVDGRIVAVRRSYLWE